MTLRISGRHMEIDTPFRISIEERIHGAALKYFNSGYSGHVTLVKSGERYSAACALHLDTGTVLQTAAQAYEPYPAFDKAAERLEKRLRRYKRWLRSHQNSISPPLTYSPAFEPRSSDFEPRSSDFEPSREHVELDPDHNIYASNIAANHQILNQESAPAQGSAPAIVAETSMNLLRLSVADAAIELDLQNHPVLIFYNAANDKINIVYRRTDGHTGWIDPASIQQESMT